jgi:hypothetical protein
VFGCFVKKCAALAITFVLGNAACVSVVRAQVDTATIVGTVVDANGTVVPAASVTAIELNTNIKTSTRTDSADNYVLTPLKIGSYAVWELLETPGS